MSHAAVVAPATSAVRSERRGAGRFRRRREILVAYLLLAPALVLVLGLQAFPLAWQVRLSLTNFSVLHTQPVFVGLRHYLEFLRDPGFWRTTAHTIGYIVLTAVLKMAVGIVVALALSRPYPGRPLVFLAAFLPWTYPAGVGIISWYWYLVPPLHTSYGLVMSDLRFFFDTKLGDGAWGFISLVLFNAWRGGSFTGIFLLAALNGIPEDLFEYADLEVRSRWRKFWMVTVPLLRPFMALAAFLSLATAVADLGNVWIQTGRRIVYPIIWTQAIHYAMIGGEWGKAFALALLPLPILAAILLICFWLFEPLEEDSP